MGKEVYFDTGVIFDYMETEQFLRIARAHGSDKILFASDSPWADQKRFVDIMKALPLTEEERENMLWKNAGKLLGI